MRSRTLTWIHSLHPQKLSLFMHLLFFLDHMGNKAKQHDMGLSIVTQDSRAKNDIEAPSRRHVKGNGMVTRAPAPLIVWWESLTDRELVLREIYSQLTEAVEYL